MKKLNLNEYIPAHYNELIDNIFNNIYPKYSIWGGRNGLKSTILAILILIKLRLSFEFGGGNVAVFRKYKASMRKTLYSEVGKVAARMGISDEYVFSKSPLGITHKGTKHVAIFDGMYDYQGIKGTTFENGVPCRLLVYEEFQEFDDLDDVEDNNITFTRGSSESEDEELAFEDMEENGCPILYAWNPLNLQNTFQYKYFRKTTEDMYCLNVNYDNIPKRWVGKNVLNEIQRIKHLDIDLYRFRFRGIVSNKAGLVLSNIRDYKLDKGAFRTVQRGLDFGTAAKGDPSVYIVVHYDERAKDLYILHEWYKQDTDYPEIADNIKKEIPNRDFTIYADNADNGGIKQLRIEGLKGVRGCKKGNVDEGILFLRSLNNIYVDETATPNAYDKLKGYSYILHKATGNYVVDTKNDDILDAIRYALSDFIIY